MRLGIQGQQLFFKLTPRNKQGKLVQLVLMKLGMTRTEYRYTQVSLSFKK